MLPKWISFNMTADTIVYPYLWHFPSCKPVGSIFWQKRWIFPLSDRVAEALGRDNGMRARPPQLRASPPAERAGLHAPVPDGGLRRLQLPLHQKLHQGRRGHVDSECGQSLQAKRGPGRLTCVRVNCGVHVQCAAVANGSRPVAKSSADSPSDLVRDIAHSLGRLCHVRAKWGSFFVLHRIASVTDLSQSSHGDVPAMEYNTNCLLQYSVQLM